MTAIVTNRAKLVSSATVLIISMLSGCSSSSTVDFPAPSGSNQSNSLQAPGADILLDQEANSTSLDSSVLQIHDLIRSRTKDALAELNSSYSSGLLAPVRADCVDDAAGYPVLQYYCGEDGVGDRLDDFGYPVFALNVKDTGECRNSIVIDGTAAACELTFADSELDGGWYAKYARNFFEGVEIVSLTLSEGVVPAFVEFDDSSSICEAKFISGSVFQYNDESVCRVAVAQVLSILQRP